MHCPKKRHFIRLTEVVEQLAGSNFSGDQQDVDRKEALDDALTALRDGTVRARGVRRETNETGDRWPINQAGDPEPITPTQWCDFEYRLDENALHDEDLDAIGHTYKATWIEDIEIDRAAAEKLWPGRISA